MFRNSLATRPTVATHCMALAQALPVGALLVRFPKQLDAALGKLPRTCKEHPKEHLGTCGVEVDPANGEHEWLAGDAGFGEVLTLVMVGVGGGALATTLMVRPLETGHSPCFRTVTETCPRSKY